MNANGQRFWMLADAAHWQLVGDPAPLAYDGPSRTLRLASRYIPAQRPDNAAQATALLEVTPQTRDALGSRAYWDAAAGKVLATGVDPGTTPVYVPAAGAAVTDLALGPDGILYLAAGDQVVLQDARGDWPPVPLPAPGFKAWRLAADPAGGAWVLDRANRQLARVRGTPQAPIAPSRYDPDIFRPVQENPDQPRLLVRGTTPANETPVALAVSPGGRLALLTWSADGEALVRRWDRRGFTPPVHLIDARHAYSLAWLSEERVAVLLAGVTEAVAYTLAEGADAAAPLGDFYPLRGHDGGPFLHGVGLPPHYPTASGSSPLYPLSLPSFAREGEARNGIRLDGGSADTVWDRLYLEASIPDRCGVTVYLAAGSDPEADVAPGDWHEHRFGRVPPGGDGEVPRGAWVPAPSELPFHPGLLPCPSRKDRAGLFTVLIQRPGRRVRALRGRYLRVRLKLTGDGRATPEVAALRAYASRFSYAEHYLPELYRESVFGPDADAGGRCTPADFLERLLDNFEGVLTPLEDRIAASYLLTDPRTTPDEALDWLAGWVGMSLDPAYPVARRRRLLEAVPDLYPWRGTVRGLTLALDVATDGAVTRGEVVIVEDFRLRRTFATILGANLADANDPLLAGTLVSGNSYVGDTLFLGGQNREEFLSLFGAGLPLSTGEQAAMDAFFDGLAFRVTVLVHEEVEPQDLGLIRRVVGQEVPAHVLGRVVTASTAFVVGMASLVGVDSYLGPGAGPGTVELGRSTLGRSDLLRRFPGLDPRLDGRDGAAPSGRPVADAGPGKVVELGASFTLDAGASHAAAGRSLVRYNWEMRD